MNINIGLHNLEFMNHLIFENITRPTPHRLQAPRIGVLDSGVGGLSILADLREKWPSATFYYGLDNDFFPYGNKDETTILARTVEFVSAFQKRLSLDIVVIACNTASTIALDSLRKQLNIPIVGVVPAIKPAAILSQSKTIGLLATEATVKRPYIDRLIAEYAGDCTVLKKGSQNLVTIAESKMRGEAISLSAIAEEVQPLTSNPQLDVVVLGCTHFSHLKEELTQIAPFITWIDSTAAITQRVGHLLRELGFDRDKKSDGLVHLVCTKDDEKLLHCEQLWQKIYGFQQYMFVKIPD